MMPIKQTQYCAAPFLTLKKDLQSIQKLQPVKEKLKQAPTD